MTESKTSEASVRAKRPAKGPRITAKPAQIRIALKFYRFMAYFTGIFLLLLVVEMVIKYVPGFGFEAMLGSSRGFFAFVPSEEVRSGLVSGFNLSTAILIVHGWGYVVYLIAGFRLWSLLRWQFSRFLLIALGGVVPFLSFVVESRLYKVALADLELLIETRSRQRQRRKQAKPDGGRRQPSGRAGDPAGSDSVAGSIPTGRDRATDDLAGRGDQVGDPATGPGRPGSRRPGGVETLPEKDEDTAAREDRGEEK